MNFITLVFIPITILLVSLIGIFVNRKNVLLIIICVELALLAINFSFLVSSYYLDDSLGQIFAFFVLSVAAAESSIKVLFKKINFLRLIRLGLNFFTIRI